MTDQTEASYVPSDEEIAGIRARVTGTCGCCGYDKHDFETADVLMLINEVDRARAELAALNSAGKQWGVRMRDTDTAEDIEVVSSEAVARELAAAWRGEIPGTNPTAMCRTERAIGLWCVVDD